VSGEGLATRAEQLAKSLLRDELPMRWLHTRRVAATAAVLSAGLEQAVIIIIIIIIIIVSGWLHDIGYASGLIDSGFHPLDGARFLRREGLAGRDPEPRCASFVRRCRSRRTRGRDATASGVSG
jgi:hypothetical protein